MKSKSKRKKLRRAMARWFVLLIIGFIAVSVLLVLPLRWLAPPSSSFMLQDRWHSGEPIAHHWVPIEQISSALPIAVVASEDQKFPLHYGFDFKALSQAVQEDRQRRRGASTITQQLAKNLYLWPGRSLVRKGLEAYFTVLIELMWPKQRIVEVYLNVVELGPQMYGVGSASTMIFNKSAARINPGEAALMAAVLPNPKRMSLANPSAYVVQRGAQIEDSVRSLGGPGYLKGM